MLAQPRTERRPGTGTGVSADPSRTVHPAGRERRNRAEREHLVARIRREFEEMPGVRLTLRQAARLFGTTEPICNRILAELAREGFTCCSPKGIWGRRGVEP